MEDFGELCRKYRQLTYDIQRAFAQENIADAKHIADEREVIITRMITQSRDVDEDQRRDIVTELRDLLDLDNATLELGKSAQNTIRKRLSALQRGSAAVASYNSAYNALRKEAERRS